ncbi:hypothetical protein SERLADRAFT_459474 [Serpula lacrymans var. lacrymans S7.9]|uniref:Uncharacterized protein n=1 Tax=Serpula lacrymans var. lacrymans (strain S7.9) TaxID=578457 RepID=F8NK50_SERL9|nr:uncharacterized protein SERLADRAFT_459474 [Serpula lacrymans var. lacrymans S7.9]EGO28734.1 hypothetical protein SERLADRAFT_459474 [Serpula lacrymans var. lacrymans S7.9]
MSMVVPCQWFVRCVGLFAAGRGYRTGRLRFHWTFLDHFGESMIDVQTKGGH